MCSWRSIALKWVELPAASPGTASSIQRIRSKGVTSHGQVTRPATAGPGAPAAGAPARAGGCRPAGHARCHLPRPGARHGDGGGRRGGRPEGGRRAGRRPGRGRPAADRAPTQGGPGAGARAGAVMNGYLGQLYALRDALVANLTANASVASYSLDGESWSAMPLGDL